ncbi:hypothetical protein E2562_002312 [Oryza meyeriana var. granulata]|uniref:Uncharacterized protein n=1 Tax=Oryza meyeriana var. granulata TaxID=110450 RepID=A0A6G1BGY8_9ORYZ|nr:hypothetical protein E2562_002312 [Oryza meyeriana var. granulata]
MRYKGCTEKGSKMSGRHKCPICKTYGHHWHNCKEGDPEQVAAMLAERGSPKKRMKKTNPPTSETSIVVAPTVAPIMTYPPRSRSLTGSNQLEPSNIVVAVPTLGEQTTPLAPTKAKGKTKGKLQTVAAPDSPAMGTRSKRKSPAMGTRSKRKLMDQTMDVAS